MLRARAAELRWDQACVVMYISPPFLPRSRKREEKSRPPENSMCPHRQRCMYILTWTYTRHNNCGMIVLHLFFLRPSHISYIHYRFALFVLRLVDLRLVDLPPFHNPDLGSAESIRHPLSAFHYVRCLPCITGALLPKTKRCCCVVVLTLTRMCTPLGAHI